MQTGLKNKKNNFKRLYFDVSSRHRRLVIIKDNKEQKLF